MKIKFNRDCKVSLDGVSVSSFKKDEIVEYPNTNILMVLKGSYDVINVDDNVKTTRVARKKSSQKG